MCRAMTIQASRSVKVSGKDALSALYYLFSALNLCLMPFLGISQALQSEPLQMTLLQWFRTLANLGTPVFRYSCLLGASLAYQFTLRKPLSCHCSTLRKINFARYHMYGILCGTTLDLQGKPNTWESTSAPNVSIPSNSAMSCA